MGIVRRAPDEVPDDTTLLPNHHTLTARSPVDLGWANGTRYIVEVGAPAAAGGGAEAHAVHVVVRLGGMAVYDVFSSAPAGSPDAIAAADQAREHLLRSVHLIGG